MRVDDEVGEDGDLVPPWAIGRATGYMDVGACLPTRDGRRVGNAYVRNVHSTNGGMVAAVVTDAGNVCNFNAAELAQLFWPPVWRRAVGGDGDPRNGSHACTRCGGSGVEP